MTSELNIMTVIRYGIIWDFLTVPDSVGTRPVILPLSCNTEPSSITPIHVSDRTDIMKNLGIPDIKTGQTMNPQIPESSLGVSVNTLIQYDTVEKKGNRFFTHWGRSGTDYPESIILQPGDNTNFLLFLMNSYFNA